MYTLIDNKTKLVLHNGLNRKRMEFLKDTSMQFLYEPDFNTLPKANITKYSKKLNGFVQLTLEEVKEARTKELADSDWRMVSDYQGSDQELWKTHRQNLRDIPQDYSRVEDIIYPRFGHVVVITWTDIEWNIGDTCLYNGISYTCKADIVKTYTIVTGDTLYSVLILLGLPLSTIRTYNIVLIDKYKVGGTYHLPPVGSVLNILNPADTKRVPDYYGSKFWDLT